MLPHCPFNQTEDNYINTTGIGNNNISNNEKISVLPHDSQNTTPDRKRTSSHGNIFLGEKKLQVWRNYLPTTHLTQVWCLEGIRHCQDTTITAGPIPPENGQTLGRDRSPTIAL